jgi:hypothetical protein
LFGISLPWNLPTLLGPDYRRSTEGNTMKRSRALSTTILGVSLFFVGACGKAKPDDQQAIRTGVINYLNSLKTLNVSAMDITVTQTTLNGNQAEAKVEVRPKGSTGGDPSMQLTYNLEKRGEEWVVVKSQPSGGSMQHPGPGQMPPGGAMPPGHPNVSGSGAQAPGGHSDFGEILKSTQPPPQQTPQKP